MENMEQKIINSEEVKKNKTPEYTLKAIKRYIEKNKDKLKEYKKKYVEKNRDSINEYNKKYSKVKRDSDEELKERQRTYSKNYYYAKKALMQKIVTDLK